MTLMTLKRAEGSLGRRCQDNAVISKTCHSFPSKKSLPPEASLPEGKPLPAFQPLCSREGRRMAGEPTAMEEEVPAVPRITWAEFCRVRRLDWARLRGLLGSGSLCGFPL